LTGHREAWRRVSVAEVCSSIVDCVNKTARTVDEPTAFKMIRTTNVRAGWVNLTEVKYVDAATYQKWTRRQKPKRGDVILTREAPLGEVGMLRSDEDVFLGQRLVAYRTDPTKLDNHFLLYAMLSDDMQGQIKSMGSGATVEHMRVPDCEKLTLRIPSLPTQRRIGSILSAYDDLIENNTRRIAILEDMARRIYEEWFVRFRFPDHETVRMVECELGRVPKDWEVVSASSAIHINPPTKVPKDGLKPFLAMNCLSNTSMLIEAPDQRSGNSGSKFRNGDTLFARITPCLENGKTGFVQFLPNEEATAFGSTEFIVLRSRTLIPEMVYLIARSDRFRDNAIKSMSGASGRQRVREACFDTFELIQPDQQTLDSFAALTRPMFRLIHTLARKNANLRVTRDLLRPKLISGELDVSSLPEPEAAVA
jgi:type I restriction enzyme, S subunit